MILTTQHSKDTTSGNQITSTHLSLQSVLLILSLLSHLLLEQRKILIVFSNCVVIIIVLGMLILSSVLLVVRQIKRKGQKSPRNKKYVM